jgi:hypothetical protein
MVMRAPSVWPAAAFRWGGEAGRTRAGADAEFPAQVEAGAAAAVVWPGPGGFLRAQAVPEAEVAQPLVEAMVAGALPGCPRAGQAGLGAWSVREPANQVSARWAVMGWAPSSAQGNDLRTPWHSPRVAPNPPCAVGGGW